MTALEAGHVRKRLEKREGGGWPTFNESEWSKLKFFFNLFVPLIGGFIGGGVLCFVVSFVFFIGPQQHCTVSGGTWEETVGRWKRVVENKRPCLSVWVWWGLNFTGEATGMKLIAYKSID